jgi:hypothetical protein
MTAKFHMLDRNWNSWQLMCWYKVNPWLLVMGQKWMWGVLSCVFWIDSYYPMPSCLVITFALVFNFRSVPYCVPRTHLLVLFCRSLQEYPLAFGLWSICSAVVTSITIWRGKQKVKRWQMISSFGALFRRDWNLTIFTSQQQAHLQMKASLAPQAFICISAAVAIGNKVLSWGCDLFLCMK